MLGWVWVLVAAATGACERSPPHDQDLAELAPIGSYRLHPELELEVAATEPLVLDPVDLEFDERGRAFVLEMPGFPFVAEGEEPPGRIVELIDDDGDGELDRRRVFADRLRYADSILPARGGMLIADAPDLLFVADTDGDGVADLRQTLLTGFGEGPSESNFNGLTWGPDNWVHGANGSSGGAVHPPGRPEETVDIRGWDFRLRLEPVPDDPHRLSVAAFETTSRMGGGFGLDFDDWGRRFVTHEQRHIQVEVFPARYLTGPHPWPSTVEGISDHDTGEVARVYPVSETEERPNHPEQAGYFTAGCGLTHYGGGALPELFHGAFFVAEAVHNLVHLDLVEPRGASFVARRERPREEVLALRDNAFRPDNFAVGPEGALYVLDIHRAVIEHPEWIPDEIEATLDVRAGEDQGRILRLVPKGGLPPARPRFERDDPGSVVAALEHPNQWWRETAQRLLVERSDPSVVEPLTELARSAADPRARLHALWTLAGLRSDGRDALGVDLIRAAIADPHPRVREAALRLGEGRLDPSTTFALASAALEDADPRVALQAALTLGTVLADDPVDPVDPVDPGSTAAALARLLRRLPDDPWIALAARSVVARRTGVLAPALAGELASGGSGNGDAGAVVEEFAAMVGDRRSAAEHLALLDAVDGAHTELRRAALRGLALGAERSASGPAGSAGGSADLALARRLDRLAERDDELADALRIARSLGLPPGDRATARGAAAHRLALDRDAPLADRLAALELGELAAPPATGDAERIESLIGLLAPAEPAALQSAAIEQLGRADQRLVAPRLVAVWQTLGPAVRRRAGDLLLYRRENHPLLLDALESGDIRVGELALDLERRRTLLRWSTPEIGERAARLFDDAGVDTRREVYEALLPALRLEGDAGRGSERFAELCARCHRLGDAGVEVGPDLSDVFRKSAESLLHDVVDPNAAVGAEHVAFVLTLDDGEVLSGLVVEEQDGVRVRSGAAGEDPAGRWVPRARIVELRSTGMSLMPEGLEAGLAPRDVADLIAALRQPR